jgi:hypothetical protein
VPLQLLALHEFHFNIMNTAHYVRLYADQDGESHFEDLSTPLSPVDFAPPAAPLNIAQFTSAERCIWVGADGDWAGDTPHPVPQRQIFCTAYGEYEITASDGTTRSFPAGSILLLEDTTGRGHSTRITSEDGCLVFGVVVGE